MKRKSNILVCPLDWGIGHSTRCVPVINELIRQNVNVIIAADNRPLAFLKNEFPALQFEIFPGYKFSYPEKGSMAFKMALQIPGIIKGIKQEHENLIDILHRLKIDAVISDNRFGLWTENVPCVFITHQINIKTPASIKFLEPFLYRINKKYISKFNECWIPDFAGDSNLSGELSHKKPLPANYYFIGPLSRFVETAIEKHEDIHENKFRNELLVLLSGPEPQRTLLEKMILKQLKDTKISTIVVCGKPEELSEENLNDNIRIFSHLNSNTLKQLLLSSKVVISRPGYSTIMDLAALGKRAIFIPTPGQTEQEYLADYFYKKKIYIKMSQNKLDLSAGIKNFEKYKGLNLSFKPNLLKYRIQNLIFMIS